MSKKSNVDVAFDIISASSEPVAFADLWKKVIEIQELDEETVNTKVGSFFTNLLLDGRFLNVGENTWGLRSRYTSKEADEFLEACYADDEDDSVEFDPEEKEDFDEEEEDDAEEEEKESFEE